MIIKIRIAIIIIRRKTIITIRKIVTIVIYIYIYIFLWSPEDSAGRVMHLKCMIEISVQGVCRQCQQYCVSSGGATVVQGLCAKLFGQLYYTIHTGFTHIFISLYIQIYIHNYICLWSPEDSAGKVMHLIRKKYSSVQGVCQQCPRYCVSSTGEYT